MSTRMESTPRNKHQSRFEALPIFLKISRMDTEGRRRGAVSPRASPPWTSPWSRRWTCQVTIPHEIKVPEDATHLAAASENEAGGIGRVVQR